MLNAARFAICFALLSMFGYRLSLNVVDLDLYHQMALARETLALGSVPMNDVFAFTSTHHLVVHHEWGAGMIAYGIACSLGAAGILALKYILALGCAGIAIAAGRPREGWWKGATWILTPVAIWLVGFGFSPVRAHAYSLLLVAATLLFLRWDRTGARKWMIAYVPLFILWVNVHGGFVLGPVILGAEILERLVMRRPWIHLALLLGGLGALVVVNPYGLAYYAHVIQALSMDRPWVSEWDPLWSGRLSWHGPALFCASLAIAAGAIALGREGSRFDGVTILALLGCLSLRHARMLPFYATAWIATVPGYFARTRVAEAARGLVESRARSIAIAGALVGALLSVRMVLLEPWHLVIPNSPGHAGSPSSFPVGAVNYLRDARFRGNVLTPFEQGAYVSWKLYPDVKVSLDSRYEAAYETGQVDSLLRFYLGAADVVGVLERYEADLVLVPTHSALARSQIPWRRVYQDDGFILYARPELPLTAATTPPRVTDTFP